MSNRKNDLYNRLFEEMDQKTWSSLTPDQKASWEMLGTTGRIEDPQERWNGISEEMDQKTWESLTPEQQARWELLGTTGVTSIYGKNEYDALTAEEAELIKMGTICEIIPNANKLLSNLSVNGLNSLLLRRYTMVNNMISAYSYSDLDTNLRISQRLSSEIKLFKSILNNSDRAYDYEFINNLILKYEELTKSEKYELFKKDNNDDTFEENIINLKDIYATKETTESVTNEQSSLEKHGFKKVKYSPSHEFIPVPEARPGVYGIEQFGAGTQEEADAVRVGFSSRTIIDVEKLLNELRASSLKVLITRRYLNASNELSTFSKYYAAKETLKDIGERLDSDLRILYGAISCDMDELDIDCINDILEQYEELISEKGEDFILVNGENKEYRGNAKEGYVTALKTINELQQMVAIKLNSEEANNNVKGL